MALNTAHANNGVLIHAGEYILLFVDNVTIEFSGQSSHEFKGSKNGRLYLTSHRLIFNNKSSKDPMQSFSFPFIAMQDVQLEQPMFGANYLKGKVRAQPNGNFVGEVKFKLHFNNGGAIEFGQGMVQAVTMAKSFAHGMDLPPAYVPPTNGWSPHPAPPPAYTPTYGPQGYYGWVPPPSFPTAPPPGGVVYMTDAPPPYPGLGGYSYNTSAYPPAPPAGATAGAYGGYGFNAGYTAGPPTQGHDAKAAEAAASAHQQYQPTYPYAPPPPYCDAPPAYSNQMQNGNQGKM
nr:EOG090X0ADZ [Triops cancriformis]